MSSRYDVLTPLKRNGKVFKPGSTILPTINVGGKEVDDNDAIEQLLESGTIGESGSFKEAQALEKIKNGDAADVVSENKELKARIKELVSENKELAEAAKKAK